jgi:hypothetical protein
MKTFAIALTFLLLASLASAQAPVGGQIGLYADINRESYCVSGTPVYEVTMYVWLRPTTPDGMAASEFKLVYPENVDYGVATINDDVVNLIIGDPQVGTSILYKECQYDWHWAFRQKLHVLDEEQSWIIAVADPASGWAAPILAACNLVYQEELLEVVSNLCLNFCTTNLYSPFIWSVTKVDAQHLSVVFSEQVTAESAENLGNYTIYDKSTASTTVPIVTAELAPDGVTALLTLGESIFTGRPYLLEARNIYDLDGLEGTSNKGFGDLPDLKFTQCVALPPYRDACSSLNVSFAVKNEGPGAAGPFGVNVEWMPLSGHPGYSPRFLLGSHNCTGLAPGETRTESFTYPWPDTSIVVNQVIYTVDPTGQMPERNEGNNEANVMFIENYTADHLKITDIGGDQGGLIRLEFETTPFGSFFPNPYKTHDVYRRDGGGWTLLTTITDDGRHKYVVDLPTMADSTEVGGICWSVFKVRTQAIVLPWEGAPDIRYFDSCSCPDSGYSVDNVAPTAPEGFAASMQEGEILLSWQESLDPNTAKYLLYRNPDPNFAPGPGTRIAVISGALQYVDPDWYPGSNYCYKLSAKDIAGNEGPYAATIPDLYVATLLQNFSCALKESAIEITWTLASIDEGGAFAVYRTSGDGGVSVEIPATSITRSGRTFTLVDEGIAGGESYHYRVEYIRNGSAQHLFTTDAIETPELPLALHQNFPNPFNPVTSIKYYLPGKEHVRLDVFDASGKLVITLVDKAQAKGNHSVEWMGVNSSGVNVKSGVYFCRLATRAKTLTSKMILLR